MAKQVLYTEGFRELAAHLRSLGRKLASRHLLRALMAGAKPIEADAKRRAPVLKMPDARRTPGTLRKNIRSKPMRRRPGEDAAVKIGVRSLSGKTIAKFKRKSGQKAADNPNDPFYGPWVERGTSKMAAQPFMRPALAAQKSTALEAVRKKLAAGVEEEARKR